MLYGKSQKIPIEKQQPRLLIARLEIILLVLTEFGYQEDQWNFREPFDLLLVPSLFHPNIEVKEKAIDLCLMLYQLIGEEIRETIFDVKGLKPQIYEELDIKMEELADIVADNIDNDNNKKLDEIQEEDEEDELARTGNNRNTFSSNASDNDSRSKKGKKKLYNDDKDEGLANSKYQSKKNKKSRRSDRFKSKSRKSNYKKGKANKGFEGKKKVKM